MKYEEINYERLNTLCEQNNSELTVVNSGLPCWSARTIIHSLIHSVIYSTKHNCTDGIQPIESSKCHCSVAPAEPIDRP